MNYLRISLKTNKKYLKLINILLGLGFIFGLILTKKLDISNILLNIKNLNFNKINLLYNHLFILIILFISSLTIIGIFLFYIEFFYEGICLGFNTSIFIKAFKLKGLIYSFIYNIFTKLIYIAILTIILKKVLYIISLVFLKDKDFKKEKIKKELKKLIIYFLIIIFNDLLIYLFGNKILSWFTFILK